MKYTLLGPFFISLLLLLSGSVNAQNLELDFNPSDEERMSAYLFTYFTGNSAIGEQIRFALSNDGLHYTPLNNGDPVINSSDIALKKSVRDPHILRGEDGQSFYMVVTDMKSNEGWSSNRGIVLLKSTDLVNWTSSTVNFPSRWPKKWENVLRVWAPQTIYDPEVGKYMVYFSLLTNDGKCRYDKIFYSYANENFTDLETEPEYLFDRGSATIDGDIIFNEEDGLYHMFFKNEGTGGICKVTSETLTAMNGNVAGSQWSQPSDNLEQTKEAVEGAGVFKLIDSDEWILMYDCYGAGHYQFCSSSDLEKFTFLQDNFSMDARHGTTISITKVEAARLVKAFPSKDLSMQTIYAGNKNRKPEENQTARSNPVIPGFHADPEVLYSEKTGLFYIYPTTDGYPGWGGFSFDVYSSRDLLNWTNEGKILDLSGDQVTWATGNAWAPCIEEKKISESDYEYYFYFSGESGGKKIGVAKAKHPTGPFYDSGSPMIDKRPTGVTRGQIIDGDVFTDPVSEKSYFYWGNGFMAVSELTEDMMHINEATTKVITPSGGNLSSYAFREGVYVFYKNGIYYFLWSVDDTGSTNYHVAYGTSDSPEGPIQVAEDPIVIIRPGDSQIYGTGHNSVLHIPEKDEWYIVYHRINKDYLEKGPGFHREVCIDRLYFNKDGTLKRVIPSQ